MMKNGTAQSVGDGRFSMTATIYTNVSGCPDSPSIPGGQRIDHRPDRGDVIARIAG